jgi:hypothetical protein
MQTMALSSIPVVAMMPRRALELATVNVANRPTLRAFEQAYAAAVRVGEPDFASEILAAVGKRWGATAAFGLSPLAARRNGSVKTDAGSYDTSAAAEVERSANDRCSNVSMVYGVNRKSDGAATC